MKLEAQGLTKNYAEKIVVNNLNIIVKPGEIVGLLGPNGAGKTTFFYMIAGLIKSDSGAILINGQDITTESVSERANRGLAYLPQEPSVFTRLTVEENLLAALEQRKDINEKESATNGDLVVFDYEATIENKSFEGGQGKNTQIVLGKDLFIKGFDKELTGVKKNETKN